jgi:pimeloyl-ACP methyl ester carboxylesterase
MTLELHERSQRPGPAALFLHALGGSSADWGELTEAWPGRAYALDFSGHGGSDWLLGGAYQAEFLVGDADVALAHIGPAWLIGAGLGAYIALLLAGGRRDLVHGAVLMPGAGLAGGGVEPDFTGIERLTPLMVIANGTGHSGCDPRVAVLDADVRPLYYVEPFVSAARRLVLIDDGGPRPPWWEAARQSAAATVVRGPAGDILADLAA